MTKRLLVTDLDNTLYDWVTFYAHAFRKMSVSIAELLAVPHDVSMARSAGLTAVWAKYGTRYDPSLWSVLVRVTHWTPEDVAREADLKRASSTVRPDYTIEAFSELSQIMGADVG